MLGQFHRVHRWEPLEEPEEPHKSRETLTLTSNPCTLVPVKSFPMAGWQVSRGQWASQEASCTHLPCFPPASDCGGGQDLLPCGRPCPHSCRDLSAGSMCQTGPTGCQPSCGCPPGRLTQDGLCVLPVHCRCQYQPGAMGQCLSSPCHPAWPCTCSTMPTPLQTPTLPSFSLTPQASPSWNSLPRPACRTRACGVECKKARVQGEGGIHGGAELSRAPQPSLLHPSGIPENHSRSAASGLSSWESLEPGEVVTGLCDNW